MTMYSVGSLFAGVGGICLGFKRASKDFNLTIANEWDRDASVTYEYNFSHSLVKGDIERILNPEILDLEQKFLIRKKLEIESVVEKKLDLEKEKFIKKQINALKDSYLLKHIDGNKFLLTESVEDKFNEDLLIEDAKEKLRKTVEYFLIIDILKERTEKWITEERVRLEEKRKKLLENKIDVLTAGFPCQAFSIAGERKGFSDHRGELFYSVLEFVKQLDQNGHGKPRVLFLENVKNLVSHDRGRTFKVITEEIAKLGYSVEHYKVMNTYEYTALPQNRERIFIICFRDEKDRKNFGSLDDILKINKTKEQLQDNLKKIINYKISKEDGSEFYYTKEKYPHYFDKKINLEEEITEMYEIYQLRRGMYVRKNQSGVCPTLTANMGTGGHNVPLIKVCDGIRKLTPEDCFNLQGFNIGKDYELPLQLKNGSLYKQAGNAVSVDMIEILAKKIHGTFLKTDLIDKNLKEVEEYLNLTKELCCKLEKIKNENMKEEQIKIDSRNEIKKFIMKCIEIM